LDPGISDFNIDLDFPIIHDDVSDASLST
jgi:hypothetical protein